MSEKKRALWEKLSGLRQTSLFKRSSWMLLAQVITISIQVFYFIGLARVLGPSDYGAFVSVAALTAIVGPFSSWGGPSIIVKHISRDPNLFGVYWGNSLFITTLSSISLSLLSAFIVPQFLPGEVTGGLVFLIFMSDLAGLPFVQLTGASLLALDKANYTAKLRVLLAASKFLAVIILGTLVPNRDAMTWAILYFLSTMLTATVSIGVAVIMLGRPSLSFQRMGLEIKQGFYFALSNSADFINSNIDKTMLASMSTLQATGLYGATYRFLDLCWYAISAVTDSAYSKFFEHGKSGIQGSISFAKRLLPFLGAYGTAAGIGLLAFSPFVTLVLGSDYGEATELLRWFIPLPCLIVFQKLAGDTLSGCDKQGLRSVVQILAAAINIILNLWLIPAYSWRGATWATLSSESVKLIGLCVVIAFLWRKQQVDRKSSVD